MKENTKKRKKSIKDMKKVYGKEEESLIFMAEGI